MSFSPYSDLMQHYYGNLVRECVARRRRELAAVDTPEKALDYVRLARERIRTGKRIANPGCHASGFIALVYPLVREGILPADYPVTS